MFIRTKNKLGKTHFYNKAVQLVESFREGQKVKQKIIKHIGVARDEQQRSSLKVLAQRYKEELESAIQPSLFNSDQQQAIQPIKHDNTEAYDDEDCQLDICVNTTLNPHLFGGSSTRPLRRLQACSNSMVSVSQWMAKAVGSTMSLLNDCGAA